MILGRDRHAAAACFVELDDAITALRPADAPPVCLNAHAFPDEIPPGAIVYNLENVGIQVAPDAFDDYEVWDFSKRNMALWKRPVTHVPVGYHPTMTRFEMRPWEERDIDVVFCGCVNERRAKVLQALYDLGVTLSLCVLGPGTAYGKERDDFLARSKLALNMLYHEDGTYPVLRAAHCAANGLAFVSEGAPERPEWASETVGYDALVSRILSLLNEGRSKIEDAAEQARERFAYARMVLP